MKSLFAAMSDRLAALQCAIKSVLQEEGHGGMCRLFGPKPRQQGWRRWWKFHGPRPLLDSPPAKALLAGHHVRRPSPLSRILRGHLHPTAALVPIGALKICVRCRRPAWCIALDDENNHGEGVVDTLGPRGGDLSFQLLLIDPYLGTDCLVNIAVLPDDTVGWLSVWWTIARTFFVVALILPPTVGANVSYVVMPAVWK